MKRICFILLFFLGLALVGGCSRNSDPNNPETEGENQEITRPKDGNGKAFDAYGVLLAANIYFPESDLQTVLSTTDWKCEYIFLYDNSHVGGKFAFESAIIPQFIHKDGTASLYNNYLSKITVTGKEFLIHQPFGSSSLSFNNVYNVVALDYTNNLKRMIVDRKTAAGSEFFPAPEGFKLTESSIRMVFVPVEE